jgi:hypothetical protein
MRHKHEAEITPLTGKALSRPNRYIHSCEVHRRLTGEQMGQLSQTTIKPITGSPEWPNTRLVVVIIILTQRSNSPNRVCRTWHKRERCNPCLHTLDAVGQGLSIRHRAVVSDIREIPAREVAATSPTQQDYVDDVALEITSSAS